MLFFFHMWLQTERSIANKFTIKQEEAVGRKVHSEPFGHIGAARIGGSFK